jgi:hypothetical protein
LCPHLSFCNQTIGLQKIGGFGGCICLTVW